MTVDTFLTTPVKPKAIPTEPEKAELKDKLKFCIDALGIMAVLDFKRMDLMTCIIRDTLIDTVNAQRTGGAADVQ